ncbi:MAG: hypothetical protein GY789_27650 [Hyphomicrobiales bacterium]|nr:hypothetical protein [Hyphomicrobiales bacterium]
MNIESDRGFPLHSGPSTESPPGTDSPYSIQVMADYLTGCQFHYEIEEDPTTFGEFRLREKLSFSNREFWVWSCKDGFGRIWDVVVGRGESPFHLDSEPQIWMFGALYKERYTPWELIVSEFPEHIHETGITN